MVEPTTSSPSPVQVPSITLQITKKDAELFLDACDSFQLKFDTLMNGSAEHKNQPICDQMEQCFDPKNKPLHEILFEAAGQCQHPIIVRFLDRMSSTTFDCPEKNDYVSAAMKAAILLFVKCDKTTKLRHFFSMLSTAHSPDSLESATVQNEEKKDDTPKIPSVELNEEDATLLFRTVLTAISCCIQVPELVKNDSERRVENPSLRKDGKNNSAVSTREGINDGSNVPPRKKVKIEVNDDVTATNSNSPVGELDETCQSVSWDSSLAPLHDEDDKMSSSMNTDPMDTSNMLSEIVEIAIFATKELFNFACSRRSLLQSGDEANTTEIHKKVETVDFKTFGEWYNSTGSKVVPWLELLQHSKWKPATQKKDQLPVNQTKSPKKIVKNSIRDRKRSSAVISSKPVSIPQQSSGLNEPMPPASRTLVSFDFSGSGSPTPLLINISEDNLTALHTLVNKTNLNTCSAPDACKTLLQAGTYRTVDGMNCAFLRKEDFKDALRKIIPPHIYNVQTKQERECFEESFADFFSCFEDSKNWLQPGEVDLKEFAVGFSFFCAGNKSSKLLTGFDLLDSERCGYLTEDQLARFLQSYLTMLVALSLLVPPSKRQHRMPLSLRQKDELRAAVQSGTKWTLGHFLKASAPAKNECTFECFANWYSSGGYSIAPWLELLDLKKVIALITVPINHLHLPPLNCVGSESHHTTKNRTLSRDRVSSLRRHHLSRRGPPPEVLFTFPLGNRRSLVVLKEDAMYVRGVVDQLGLLTMKPDILWNSLLKAVEAKSKRDGAVYVDMATFVQCMKEVCPNSGRKRSASGVLLSSGSMEEILANFFECFDIERSDCVALDELMGGLTLLCGGKKSTKLAFAFSIFDTRSGAASSGRKSSVVHSLSGEDLFLFLRSVLIVTFSTCRQSLDMSDDTVGRCIADTANMICNDVMRHQWETKQRTRLDFDEFGLWYNDGGFERAPWLELLDLNKWVLLDAIKPTEDLTVSSRPVTNKFHHLDSDRFLPPTPGQQHSSTPPPPPEEALDNSFLDEIDSVSALFCLFTGYCLHL